MIPSYERWNNTPTDASLVFAPGIRRGAGL